MADGTCITTRHGRPELQFARVSACRSFKRLLDGATAGWTSAVANEGLGADQGKKCR